MVDQTLEIDELYRDMTFEELEKLIIDWGKAKGICHPENRRNQLLKSFEEMGELVSAEFKNDMDGVVDGIGDAVVTLILYSYQKGFPIVTCLESAYNEIKDRTGRLENGSFIKD